MAGHFFISYSRADGEQIALTLGDQLAKGPPPIGVWLDRRRLQPGIDWDKQLVEALRACDGLLFVMTEDSVSDESECKKEWTRALKYKKPIVPLLFDKRAELPYRLEPREYIDFTASYDAGLAGLREHLRWRMTPDGVLHVLKERLADARRDLARADPAGRRRVEDDIAQLEQQIGQETSVIENPEEAARRTQQSIERGLELERQPEQPVAGVTRTRFVNRPPMVAPTYFQDRLTETAMVGDFLKDVGLRMMTVVGRGGVGKTAMVCRLLKALEGGQLPDDGGALRLDGIVYLETKGAPGTNFASIFAGLIKLLPEGKAERLDQMYRDARRTPEAQALALLEEFQSGRTVLLLDNFEDLIDGETLAVKDQELDEALRALLSAPPHGVKVILTTRIVPQALLRYRPALQQRLDLDEGLPTPFAENILRARDPDGKLGLKHAPDVLLVEARERTLGYPRALEALAGILSADRDTKLPELLGELEQLQPKAQDIVEALVGEAFNRLDPSAQQVMQALAIYGVPVPPVAVDFLLQPHRVGINSAPVLSRLVNMQFVRRDAGRYYLHQVDRDYALSRIAEGEPTDRDAEAPIYTRYALRHRAAEYFRETRTPRDAWKTPEDLAPQLVEFDLRIAGKNYDAAAQIPLEIDDDYLALWGYNHLLINMYEQVRSKTNDYLIEQFIGNNLAHIYLGVGRSSEALSILEDALALSHLHNNIYARAGTLPILSYYHANVGQLSKALELTEKAKDDYVQLGDKAGEAICLGNIACRLRELGRITEATRSSEQALALHRQLANRSAECDTLYNLANSYRNLGDLEKARALANDAKVAASNLGYRLIEATAANLLGNLLVAEGHSAWAVPELQQAIRIADELGDVQFQQSARAGLAEALLQLDDLAGAAELAREVRVCSFTENYDPVLLSGIIASCQADPAGALEAFGEAWTRADEQVRKEALDWGAAYARALATSGLALWQDAGLVATAVEAYRNARAITSAPGIVAAELRMLDTLAAVDRTGLLKPIRAAAVGQG